MSRKHAAWEEHGYTCVRLEALAALRTSFTCFSAEQRKLLDTDVRPSRSCCAREGTTYVRLLNGACRHSQQRRLPARETVLLTATVASISSGYGEFVSRQSRFMKHPQICRESPVTERTISFQCSSLVGWC